MVLEVDLDKDVPIKPEYLPYMKARILNLHPIFKNLNATDQKLAESYF